MTQRVCICLGDGGTDDKTPLMDLYIIAQARKKNPTVCLLPTASGDHPGYIEFFKRSFGRYPCIPKYLSLFRPHTKDIADFLTSMDAIFVGGGHTKSMLGVWKEWNLPSILKDAYNNGTVLSGGSAGSVCWFDQCITDSIPGELTVMDCLGFLPYSNSPHFASSERRETYSKHIADQSIKDGFAADDYAALHFIDEQFFRSVSSRKNSRAFKLSHDNGACKMEKLATKYLQVHQELIWDRLTEGEE